MRAVFNLGETHQQGKFFLLRERLLITANDPRLFGTMRENEMRENDWTKVFGWPEYRAYQYEVNEWRV